MKPKYIVFDYNGLEVPVLFPAIIQHKELLLQSTYPIISAGYFSVADGKVIVGGDSLSLNVKCRPEEDADLIQATLNIL